VENWTSNIWGCGGEVELSFFGVYFERNLKLCFSKRLGNQCKILGVEDLSVIFETLSDLESTRFVVWTWRT
jgi:hypothetical protein